MPRRREDPAREALSKSGFESGFAAARNAFASSRLRVRNSGTP